MPNEQNCLLTKHLFLVFLYDNFRLIGHMKLCQFVYQTVPVMRAAPVLTRAGIWNNFLSTFLIANFLIEKTLICS